MKLINLMGLDIEVNNEGLLEFNDSSLAVKPTVRTLAAMQEVLQEKDSSGPAELYWMYRNVLKPEHKVVAKSLGIRYDVTVLRPGQIGNEYVKTYGHYHPTKLGTNVAYPEVYEVLTGQALYIMQKRNGSSSKVESFISVIANPGDKVIIPPHFGHVTVNIGTVPLVMSNWVASGFESEYEDVRELQGMAYYAVNSATAEATAEADSRPQFVFNGRYKYVTTIGCITPTDYPEFGLFREKPMYNLIEESPEKLEFLVKPEYFSSIFYRYSSISSDIIWQPAGI